MTRKPSYRFAGYTEPWSEKKLGEVTDRYDNLRVPVSANARISGNIPYYGANGIQDFVNGYTHDGEFILIAEDGASDVKDYPVQYVNGKVWVNNHAHVIQGKDDLIKNIFLLFAVKRINIEPFLVGGGRAKLNSDVMMKLPLHLPSLSEQTAIGSFFQDIDQLISLQQRKLEVLKEQKKTYLKLLFPAKGQTKPALRFAGFEDEWKEVKLGDFVEISKGIQRNKEFLSPNADSKNCYPVYNGGKQESGYTDEFNREGNIMISEGGASAGFVNYFDGKYWSGGHNFTIDELENDIYYVLALLESQQQELYSLQVGSGLPNIQLNSLKKVIITFPAFLEQEAIGSFFQDLDKAIAKQEEKVNQLKESKQTLLRKMFI